MTSRVRGRAIIVNIIDSKDSPEAPRKGSEVDAKNLKNLYEQLGFTVHEWLTYTAKVILRIHTK